MAVKELGHGALQGWRAKAADKVAPTLARRTPLRESDVRAVLGLVFLALTARYLLRTFRDTTKGVRGG